MFIRAQGPVSLEDGRENAGRLRWKSFYLQLIITERIRPFLIEYPFKPENLDIAIINYQLDRKNIFHPDIEVFSIHSGKVEYLTRDPDDTFKYKSEIFEPYSEALAIVKNEAQAEVHQTTK